MRLKFWGVRGSLPAPIMPDKLRFQIEDVLSQFDKLKTANASVTARAFMDSLAPQVAGGYGGNTSCGEATFGKSRLIIDGGSGIRNLSEYLMKAEPAQTDFHIYLTHFHWDHLIGLPFFVPLYIKGKTVHFYSAHDAPEDALTMLFKKPFFPVPFSVIKPQIQVHKVEPRKPFQIGEITVTPFELDHPDPCWGARVEAGGKALAWAVDTEGTRTGREELGADLPLYTNADLMVFDAQYSFGEALEKINWGHSSGPIGIDLALREKIKRVAFVHHDPSATDMAIWQGEEQTRHYYDELLSSRRRAGLEAERVEWHFAREGETIQL